MSAPGAGAPQDLSPAPRGSGRDPHSVLSTQYSVLPGGVRDPGFNWLNLVLALGLLGVFVVSAQQTHFSLTEPFQPNNVRAIGRFVGSLFPPELSPDFLRTISGLVLETLEISIVGTGLAVLFGLPLGLLGMRRRGEETSLAAVGLLAWTVRWLVYGLARTAMNLARAIPELVWALVFVVAVGLGPFPGVLALAAHSAGVLGKLYSELFESVDQRVVEAARSTGAGELRVLLFTRIPLMLPVLLSYTLFRWECNMRAATVLGFVGAGGIGTQLAISMKLFRYNEVLTLILAILLLVTLVDIVGQIARARILEPPTVGTASAQQPRGVLQRALAVFGRA
jgi:phosphonate transport system permease protein